MKLKKSSIYKVGTLTRWASLLLFVIVITVTICGCGMEAGIYVDEDGDNELDPIEKAMGISGDEVTGEFTLRKGHVFVNRKAIEWLEENDALPEGIDEYMMNYGAYYADYPWTGRPHKLNVAYPGPLDSELNNKVADSDWNFVGFVFWYCRFNASLRWKKGRIMGDGKVRPNLYLEANMNWNGTKCGKGRIQPMAVENASHFANRKDTVIRVDGIKAKGWRANVTADHYGAQLYKMARRFWESSVAWKFGPSMSDMECVDNPGKVFIYDDDVTLKAPSTCLGGAPFILAGNGYPTWPLWVPDEYDAEKLMDWDGEESDRAGSIYLGWALHLLQDLYVPYHAIDESSDDAHAVVERDLDNLIRAYYKTSTGEKVYLYDHLPVFSAQDFKYANKNGLEPSEPDLFLGMWSKKDFCSSNLRSELLEKRFAKAYETSKKYVDRIAHEAFYYDKLASWEYLLNEAIKDAILLIYCIDVLPHVGYHGYIKDKLNGAPIAKATITVEHGSGQIYDLESNTDGYFKTMISEGKHTVTITHQDYETKTLYFIIPRNFAIDSTVA